MSKLVHNHSRDALLAWGLFFGIILLVRLLVPYVEEYPVVWHLPTPPPAIQMWEREVESTPIKGGTPTPKLSPRDPTSLA